MFATRFFGTFAKPMSLSRAIGGAVRPRCQRHVGGPGMAGAPAFYRPARAESRGAA